MSQAGSTRRTLGVGVISLGWVGRVHTRAHRALSERYPELGVTPQLALAADPVASARAGKPFWIEKPMGVDAAQSAEIARAALDAGLVTCVGFNCRQAPGVAFAR